MAWQVIESFAAHVSEGMVPNRFPDAGEEPEYNSIDASLWFVHASIGILPTARILPEFVRLHGRRSNRFLMAIVEAHDSTSIWTETGSLPGVRPGTQLTWMDAKVGDWVVTPRSRKAGRNSGACGLGRWTLAHVWLPNLANQSTPLAV